ncbi:MAG: TetR/AcrR family transcriptional regulator [Bacteroidota bacterium]
MPLQKTTPDEIIKHSIQVFREKGYYRTSMSDLARSTGLTKGVFYHHFQSKEEVMIKSLNATRQWFDHKIFSISYDESILPEQRLNDMMEVLYTGFTRYSGGCFFANTVLETAHVEDTFMDEINGFFKSFENALRNIYKSAYMEKELDNVIQQIIADIEGTIILMQLRKDPGLLKTSLKRAIKLL